MPERSMAWCSTKPSKGKMGLDPHKALAVGNDGIHLEHAIGVKVMKLQPIVPKQPPWEGVDWKGEAHVEEADENDPFSFLRHWGDLLARASPCNSRGGQPARHHILLLLIVEHRRPPRGPFGPPFPYSPSWMCLSTPIPPPPRPHPHSCSSPPP